MDRLERTVCRKLETLLAPSGFTLHQAWGFFVRPQPYGHDAFMVVNQGTAGVGPRHFELAPHCSVRHDCIEVPWNSLGLVYGAENQLQTATLVLGFPRGMQAPPLKVFPATRRDDLARVAEECYSVFIQHALPFFERFANVAAIEKLANDHPLQDIAPYTVGGPMEHRGMRSLLLAKTINPSRYATVRELFVHLDKGMFPRERRMEMLQKIDAIVVSNYEAQPSAGEGAPHSG
jgi:hypothetical protein